jgi:hypothetical protein
MFVYTTTLLYFFFTLGPFLHPYDAHKLDYHSTSCVCLGYSSSHLGYHCLDLSSYIYIFYHVRFHEYYFPFIESEQVHNTSPYVFTPTLNTNLPLLTTFPVLNTSSPRPHFSPIWFRYHHLHLCLLIILQNQVLSCQPYLCLTHSLL